MDVSTLEPSHVAAGYIVIESVKWLSNRFVNEKEQFKVLHSISKSQEAVAESFNHVAMILEKILSKMGKKNV